MSERQQLVAEIVQTLREEGLKIALTDGSRAAHNLTLPHGPWLKAADLVEREFGGKE